MARASVVMESERLILVRHTSEAVLALIERPEGYEELSGFPAATGLREFFVSDEVSPEFLTHLRALDSSDAWRPGFGIVDRETGRVVGTVGFRAPPDSDGMVEIAYGVVPDFEGRGYATQAAGMVAGWALARDGVRVVRAHTLPEANASTRVLTKCGFAFGGEVVDPQDGRVWRWELASPPRAVS
jgi:ribosomal-protein-alanine N-acetyltransferase